MALVPEDDLPAALYRIGVAVPEDDLPGAPTKKNRSYLGAALESGVRTLGAAGATVLDAINPFTLSEEDAATLYKDDPEGFKRFQEESAAAVLQRFAAEQTKRSREVMQEVSPDETGAVSDKPLGELEYATLDPEKAAYLSPTRVAGDVLQSLPSTLALAVSGYFTRGKALQAYEQALARETAKGVTKAEAQAIAKAEAVREGAKSMAVIGGGSEGVVTGAQQFNQALDQVGQLDQAKIEQSPEYQALLDEGYAPETARATLANRVATQSGVTSGVTTGLISAVGGRYLGGLVGEGGSLLPRVGKGFLIEGATEAPQSTLEQINQNVAMQRVDPSQNILEGAGEAAAAGFVVGGVTGGAFGAAFGGGDTSRQRQKVAEQALREAPDAATAAAAANELAGSVADLESAIDQYLTPTGAIPTPEQAAATPAPQGTAPREDPTRAMIDRQAGLIAQAQAAPTAFDRQLALDQAQTALPQPEQGRSAGFVDLTPMNDMQAQQRLAVLRDETARAGGNALALAIVPHPAQANRFAIAEQALPDLSLPQAETNITPDQAQFQIESAALGGQVSQARAEDSATRGPVIDQALKAVEARGGVASPAEARIFQEAGIGQPYDRVDPTLGPEPAPLIETAGASRESFTPNQQIADQEVQADQQARRQSDLAQRDRQLQGQIAAAGRARPAPDAGAVISALVTPGRQRSAEQVRIVNEARDRYSPEDFSILERAATAPFQLNTPERMRLRELRNPPAVPQTSTTVPESGTGLLGTRVAERLGQPSGGRIITTNAKLSTQRVSPGGTVTINDGGTQHEARVVEPARLGTQGRLLQQIARLFNKRLVAFESDTLQADGFVRDGDNDSIYINAKSQMSPLAVFGHELTHLLKRDNPEAYAALEAVVRRELREGATAEFEQDTGYDADASLEELTSDLVGNRFQEPDFWQSVFDEIAAQNPEGARGIIARVAAAINRAINAFRKLVTQPGFDSDQYVKDINAVKRAVNQALVAYMQQPRLAAEQTTEQAVAEVTREIQAAGKPSMAERLREAARAARTEMGETVTASKARRGGVVEQAGDFTIRTQKDGTLGVSGDPEAIRALLPEGIAGRAVPGGVVFTATAAPRVRAALEGRKLAYSRAGQVTEKLPMKDGKYVGAPEKFNTPGKITQLRKWLNKLAREGEAGRYWYENSSREVLAMVGGNVQEARKFVALLSIYSPQAKVDANSTFALRAWAQYKAGQPISVKTGVQDRKAQEALDNVDAFWSGEKTGNFFFNLLREIDPSTAGRQGATIDMWMMRAGQYSNDAPTATQYAFMENETNRLAQELGWEPQQVQAAIWVAMKARMENAGVKKRTEASSEKKGWIRYEYPLKNGKPRKTRVIVDAQKHRDNWLKHAFEHDPTKDDTQQAKFDFSDGLRRHVGQLSWEARPGRSTNVLPGVNDAPYEQQVEFQQAVQKALLDDNGVDLLAYKLGMLVDGPDILAPGVWQGEIAAGMQKLVALAPAKGDEGKTSIDPAQKKAIETYAAVLGLLLRQEGVGYHRPFYSGKKSDGNGVDIDLGRTLSPAEAQSLWAAINERMNAAGVENWENGAGMISSPTGMRVVNFGAIDDNKVFQNLVDDAASTLAVDELSTGYFASDGDLIYNDWQENVNGESYKERIVASGSPDLLEWAGTVLAPRIQSVFNEFSSRYGWGDPGRVDALFDQPAAAQDQAQLSRRRDQKNPDRSRVGDQSADRFLRTPELQQAVTDLQEGRITRAEYDRLVDELRPVYPYDEVPPLTTPEEARYALATGRGQSPEKAAKYGLPSQQLKKGDMAQLRLDIPSYQNHDAWVVSVHTPKSTNVDVQAAYDAGPVVGYESVGSLTDVYFGMNQSAALKIAQGTSKGTIATILGKWNPISNEQAKARAEEAINDPAWTQVGMDPFRHSYFYDRDTMRPVLRADEVIQIGPLVLAKNAQFGKDEDVTGAPFKYSRQRGINVRNDGDNRYADFIVDGEKTMESRDSDSLRPYVGRTVGIIRTGEGPAKLIGTVKIGEPVEVDEQEFRARESEHLVPEGSEFDIKPGSTKFLYPLTEAERFDDERDVDTLGIVARQVQFSRQRSFYRELLPEAGYTRITDADSPRIYKDAGGRPYATFEKDGARAAFSSNNILYQNDRGRVDVGYGEENESILRALIVDSDKRQQGRATAVMQDVINAADGSGTVLYLEPTPIGGNKMSAKQLADFYKRFGFVQAEEGSDKVLVRQPAASAQLSRRRNYGSLNAAQEQALRNVGGIVPDQTLGDRLKELGDKFKKSWFSGIFDQFAPLKDVDQRAYMLARLSKGSDGALEALMLYGKPFMNGDVPDVKVNDEGFIQVMASLKGEHDRFLWWVAAQRAENIKANAQQAQARIATIDSNLTQLRQARKAATAAADYRSLEQQISTLEAERSRLENTGQENLFTDQDISSLKSLNQGNFEDGTPRAQAYADALAKMNDFNDAVLNIAEQSGLIDGQARQLFKDMPYVPFYRVMEDGVEGPSFSSGLVNQQAWKKLKGGTQKLNEDLLSNVLLNWAHLFDAAGKNRAAVASMQAATQIGIAQQVPAGTKGAVKVMEQGQTKHYTIDDPYVMEAVTALNYQPPGFFSPFSTFKKWLTIGVTASPTFKIKNLMRDSLQAIGTAPMSYNVASNVMKGFKQGSQETQTFASMLAGGGLIRFGSMLENNSRTNYMIERQGGILLNEGGWKKLQRQMTGLVEAYAELGDRLENVNRVSLYEHLLSKGYSQAEANFMSRDLMDFSLQGRWPVVRFLAQSVPFLNARLQGLSKLGRGAKEDPRRFGYVVGAVAMASIALMLAYEDDEDWKKRPDWDRDSNWWFKIGDTAFRIPKPFEIGAIGTVAERTWELAFNDEMSWKRYRQRLSHMIFETFAMDPTPQLVVPIAEIYANKDGFTGRPVEGMSLQKLRPEDRATESTSSVARMLGQMGLPNPVALVKGNYEKLSPVQIDHLVRGYFGWIGTTASNILDFGLRPLMDRGERPAYRLKDIFVVGNFAEGLPAGSSRYVDQLYDQARVIEQAYMSYREAVKKGDRERARELLAEEGDKIRAYRAINKISDRVSEINRKIRQIDASRTLSAETKRKMIDQLSQRKDAIAKQSQRFSEID